MDSKVKADFCIEIDFQKGSESPSRIFRAMTEIIETFQEIDITLIRSIDTKIEPIALIEDVETGSLKAWLKYALRETDDEALKQLDWKPAVGKYLVKAKYFILNFIDKKTEIVSREEVEQLEKQLLQAAEETDVTNMPSYTVVQRQKLLPQIGRLTNALKILNENDKAIYIYAENEIRMNACFNYIPENIETLLTQEEIISTSEMILKVKKPDYLGESMWEFRHGTRQITAKILHQEWLKEFQDRKIDIRPGDSLRSIVNTVVKYGYDNEVVGTHYEINEIKEVIPLINYSQLNLLPPNKE